jgi:predicted acyl esterase
MSRCETLDSRGIVAASTGAASRFTKSSAKRMSRYASDGITLNADAFRPDASGKFPVPAVRIPHDEGAVLALTERDSAHRLANRNGNLNGQF